MVKKIPDKPQITTNIYNFSNVVNMHLKVKGWKQSDLLSYCCLSKATVSRICRNTNDKGKPYVPTIDVIMAVTIGLRLNREEAKELLFCAFPKMKFWGDFLDNHLTIDEANYILMDKNLPLLGNTIEE